MVKIAVDAMGGDNAPVEIVKGAVKFIKENKNAKIYLFGCEKSINEVLEKLDYNKGQIEVVATTEVITNEEQPMVAIKAKKDSSLVQALRMVKSGEASGVISAGSTGALITGATIIIGRIKGVKRPTLATIIPAAEGKKFLLADSGANVDSKPEYIAQYAVLGSIYMKMMLGVENPKVGLANVGTEDAKGDALAKDSFKLLKEEDLNFVGNIEARDIPFGVVDVVACDGFVGNVILKLYEGLGKMIISELKESLTNRTSGKLGSVVAKKSLKDFKNKFDTKDIGGAPIIGLKGLAVKAHGNSEEQEFYAGLKQCYEFIDRNITEEIASYFAKAGKDE